MFGGISLLKMEDTYYEEKDIDWKFVMIMLIIILIITLVVIGKFIHWW